jgi:hypothetical protein
MKIYIPHTLFFTLISLIIAIGIASNNLFIAAFFGSVASQILAPEIIITGLLIGIFTKGQIRLIVLTIVFGFILSLIVGIMNSRTPIPNMYIIIRCIAILVWAYPSNAIILFKNRHEKPQPKNNIKLAIIPILAKFIIKIKQHFKQEYIWRLFIVFQATGLFTIIYLFNTISSYSRGDEFDWYIGILLLFPYLVSKSINWINEANKKSSV